MVAHWQAKVDELKSEAKTTEETYLTKQQLVQARISLAYFRGMKQEHTNSHHDGMDFAI